MNYDHTHSVEQMGLLLQYISIATIVIGLPSAALFVNKDERFVVMSSIFVLVVIVLIALYNIGYKPMFPDITIT
jgi:hypothetical protein